MNYNVPRYFERKKIKDSDIMYLTRQNPHTIITLLNGEKLTTSIPVKEIALYLPTGDYLNITKGIILRKDQIVNISDEGLYTMTDGCIFQGRKRNVSQHKQVRKSLNLPHAMQDDTDCHIPLNLLEKCSLLDKMPLAFCIIELVFDECGHGVDFIFRYCNAEMAVVEGVPVSEMLNHSFYEVFKNGDKKWLVAYADVALNGTRRVICDFSSEIGQTLTIHCYQPSPGYCACILIPA